ncbi:hypothetical protein [Mucilaginibacter gilvus]|uniref:Uncharacterized protein n=1 Tax=Mucilaginibacter gilvus TaxID=2305909 RepID=A0A444MTC4_9SPHI|nr:hypothetical protein [Mucilaginibacter gilvus]RWY55855.1 hypothetical protein EPL05_05650 [Mucilaginibacter gilvus]
MNLDNISTLDLHDQTVSELSLDLEHCKIIIGVSVYNELTQNYDDIRISFHHVKNLKMDAINLPNLEPLEINAFDISIIESHKCAKILLLQGFGNPTLGLFFLYSHEVIDI